MVFFGYYNYETVGQRDAAAAALAQEITNRSLADAAGVYLRSDITCGPGLQADITVEDLPALSWSVQVPDRDTADAVLAAVWDVMVEASQEGQYGTN